MRSKYYINAKASVHSSNESGDRWVCDVDEPDYKRIITNANMRRRMSRIVKMGVACALECIAEAENKEIDGIITATGFGCLGDTEKFLKNLIENEEEMLNPTAFIQSTFNTIGAQIALITKNQSYNTTYVHRGLSFESALLDAVLCLNEGSKQVLVGAADELTPSSVVIQRRLGLLMDIKAGEGAHFFILSSEEEPNTNAALIDLETFVGKCTPDEILRRIDRFLVRGSREHSFVDFFMCGVNKKDKQQKLYKQLEHHIVHPNVFTFKDESGEYPTASAYGLWKASVFLKEQKKGTSMLIYNQYNRINHSLILLQR